MAVRDLLVKILVDDSETSKFDKTGDRAGNMGEKLGSASTGATVGLAALAGGALAAAQAAAGAEQSSAALQFALDKFPKTADTTAAKLLGINKALSLKTKFDDDAIASGQAVLAQYNLTGAQIEQLTPLLADYAAKTGQDIPEAAESLGKAMLGQGRALKAIGIQFKDTGSLGGNFDAIVGGLTEKVGGFAEVQGVTATGSAAILQNAMENLMESLGQQLLPMFVEVTKAGLGVIGWMQDNAELVKILAIAAGGLAVSIIAINGAYQAWTAIQALQTAAQWASNAAWLASPTTWIIIGIIAAIALLVAAGVWLVNNWDGVSAWFGELWKGIGAGVAGFFSWVSDAFLNFTPLGFIIKNWDAITAFFSRWVSDVQGNIGRGVDWIGGKVGEIVGFFTAIPDRVGDAWNGLLGMVQNIARSILSFTVGLWNSTLGQIDLKLPDILGGARIKFPRFSIPALAEGGIATSATLALIGEAGPEAVVPLSRGAEFGFGSRSGVLEADVPITLNLDGSTLIRLLKRIQVRQAF